VIRNTAAHTKSTVNQCLNQCETSVGCIRR